MLSSKRYFSARSSFVLRTSNSQFKLPPYDIISAFCCTYSRFYLCAPNRHSPNGLFLTIFHCYPISSCTKSCSYNFSEGLHMHYRGMAVLSGGYPLIMSIQFSATLAASLQESGPCSPCIQFAVLLSNSYDSSLPLAQGPFTPLNYANPYRPLQQYKLSLIPLLFPPQGRYAVIRLRAYRLVFPYFIVCQCHILFPSISIYLPVYAIFSSQNQLNALSLCLPYLLFNGKHSLLRVKSVYDLNSAASISCLIKFGQHYIQIMN